MGGGPWLEVFVVFRVAEEHHFFVCCTFCGVVEGFAAFAFYFLSRRDVCGLVADLFEYAFT
jgi:hypothetical protein